MANEAIPEGANEALFERYGLLGAQPPEPPIDLPGVPDAIETEWEPLGATLPEGANQALFERYGLSGAVPAEQTGPKPLVPKEVRDNARRADISDEDSLRLLPDQLSYEPSAELLEDVDWQRDPEAFEIAHRKMVSQFNRARSASDKAEIMMEWTYKWNPSLAKSAEQEAGVFMRAGVGALTGLANVVLWVDSWSARPVRSMVKSLWASRERDLRGGGSFSMDEMADSISSQYHESDASFEDGENTLKAMSKYVAAVGGSPFAWLHQEATGGAYTDSRYADSINEGVDKMFDWGADVIQAGAWTTAGVAAELWPGGKDYGDWKEKRKKSIEEGSSFGHGTLGFIGLLASDPIMVLSFPGAFERFGVKFTGSGENIIKDATAMRAAAKEKEIRELARLKAAKGEASPYLDDAGEIIDDAVKADAAGLAQAGLSVDVVDVADTAFRNNVAAHGWGSVETLKVFREAITETDPSYWKSVLPEMTDEAAEAAAGQFVTNEPIMALVEGILKKSGVTVATDATNTMKLESAWAHLAKESAERKELFNVTFKMTGEVDPNTGKEVIEHFVDWVDPRKVLNSRGHMHLALEPGVLPPPTVIQKAGLAVEEGMVGAAGAAGRAIRKRGPVTAEQAAKLDDAARAVAFDKTRIISKSDNRRVRWGMALINKMPMFERWRMNVGSMAFLQKAQPYISRVGSNYHRLKPMHGAMWGKWERLELRDQATRTLNRQVLANHVAKIEEIVTPTGERGMHVRQLAILYEELGTRIPVTEGQLEALAWITRIKSGIDDIEAGIPGEGGLRAIENLSIETLRLLKEAADAGGVSDLVASLAKDLEKIQGAVGTERKELLETFKGLLNINSDILKKVLVDDYRVKSEMATLGELVPHVEKLKSLRAMKTELEEMFQKKDLSDASSLESLTEQLRIISRMQDEGIEAVREGAPQLAKNEAELLQHLRTTGFIPEGSFTDWSTHKDWLHDRVRNAVRATGVDDWELQGEAVMATMKARADSWALWNKLPEDYADSWFTKYSKDIEEEVLGRAVEAAPMESAAKRIADTLDGVEGKRILSEMQESAVTPEMGTAYAKLAASRANAWAIANDRPAQEFLARLHIRTAKDVDEVFGKTIYEIDPDFKPREIIGGTGKRSDSVGVEGDLPWQWQLATPRELDDFMDLLGGKYREDYVKKVAGVTESEVRKRKIAAWIQAEKASKEFQDLHKAWWKAVSKENGAEGKLLKLAGANNEGKPWSEKLRFYVRPHPDGTERLVLAPQSYANLDADELLAKDWPHKFRDPEAKTAKWRKLEAEFWAARKANKDLWGARQELSHRIKDAVWNQDKLKSTNGFIVFGEQEKVAIFLLESASPGTLGHELGHFFRRDLPQEVQDRAATWAESASGIGKVGDKWSIGMEEAFAEAFELYLKTGVAPKASGMAEVFRKFKEWIKQIMSPLIASGKLKKLDPEIRSIFDEMFDAGSIRGGTGSAAARAVDDGRQIISSFQSSTFQDMIKGVGRIFAKDLPKKDYEIASDWIQREIGSAGFLKNGDWSEAGRSMWAQGFANWTKSGKVTNHGLREVFAKFKDWIFRVYRAVSGNKEYKFKISPEVEDVFDRLLSKQAGYKTHSLSREFDVMYRTYMTSMGGSDSILSKALLNEVLVALMEAAKYAPHQIRQTERMLFSKKKEDSIKAYNFIKEEVADKLAARFDPPRDRIRIEAPKFKNNRESFSAALVESLQRYAGLAGDEARSLVDNFYDEVKDSAVAGRFTYQKGSDYYQEMVVGLARKYVQLHPEKAPGYPRIGYEVPNRTVADIVLNHERARAGWKERGPRFEARMPAEGEVIKATVRYEGQNLASMTAEELRQWEKAGEARSAATAAATAAAREAGEPTGPTATAKYEAQAFRADTSGKLPQRISEETVSRPGGVEFPQGARLDYYKATKQLLEAAGTRDADELARRILAQPGAVSQREMLELDKAIEAAIRELDPEKQGMRRIRVESEIITTDRRIASLDEQVRAANQKKADIVSGKTAAEEAVAEEVLKRGPGIEELPSKLKKKSPGRYATEDGRFVVERVDGYWEWYVLEKKGGEVIDEALMESGGFGTKRAAEDDLKKHLSEFGKDIHPEGGTWGDRMRAAEDAADAAAPKPAAAAEAVPVSGDLVRQAADYRMASKLPEHKDIAGELAGMSWGGYRQKVEGILADVLKREHGVEPRVAKLKAEQEFAEVRGKASSESLMRDMVESGPDLYVKDLARVIVKDVRPEDIRFNIEDVDKFLRGEGRVPERAAMAAVEAREDLVRLEAELAELTARKAELAGELKALDVTSSEAYLAEAGEVSARRESISQAAVDSAKAQTKWLAEEIAKKEALIGGARAEARAGADRMAKAAYEEELAPMATYVEGKAGRRRRVLGEGEEEITGAIERIEKRIAEGLTRGQPGRIKDAADLPTVIPKKLTESMRKKIDALPGAKKEMLDIARRLNWELKDTGKIWERIVNYRTEARSYGDLAEAKRAAGLEAIFDYETMRSFNAMPEVDKTIVYSLLKDPRKYSLPPGASPKMKKMAEDLGMSTSGKEDLFIHLSGKSIQKDYGVPLKKVKVGEHFKDYEIEEALRAAEVIREFLAEKLKKLQSVGRLTKYRDKKVGTKIDAINRKIRGTDEMVGAETKASLQKELDELLPSEFRDWTEQEFLRRVGVAGYIPHMMRIAARRKIEGMRGGLLPANYKTGFEHMRTRASVLDDINEMARNELAEDMLYHDITSVNAGGPGFVSTFTGKSREELEAIYDAAASQKLREHFSDEEWTRLLKAKRDQAQLDGIYDFFETDYFILIKRYSESVDKAIADQVFIKDMMDMFPIGREMGLDPRFRDNPDLAREFGYVRLTKRDHLEAVGRMKLPKELTPDIENWVNQQILDGREIPEIMAGLRRKGVNVNRNVIELYKAMPDVFVPEPVMEYLRWMRAPAEVNPGWGVLLGISDGFHALAKTMATVAAQAHIGMNFTGNYASIAQKIGTDLFNPRHHYNSWIMMASDTWPELLDDVIMTVGSSRRTVKSLKMEFASHGIDESPRTLAFLEEALGRGDTSAAKAPLKHMILGSGIGATGGWIAGSAMAGPLGGVAGGFLGSWVGAMGGEILGKSWRSAIDPATGKAVAGVLGKKLDLAKGVGSVSDTEVGKFVESITQLMKGKPKAAVQEVGERIVGSLSAGVVGSAIGGPATAVAGAIGGLTFPSYIRMMSSLNQSVEIQARRLLGLAELSRGKSLDAVSSSVSHTLRNYSHLTPMERNILRRLFFFYTWDAGNVRFQLTQLVKYPRQAAIFNQFMAGIYNGQFTESEIQALPEYLRWRAIVRLGGAKIYSFSGLPQQAAIELSRGFGTHGGKPIGIFSRGRPDVMLAMEWLLNKESLYYSKGWNELNNVRQMKNAPPALKWIVGYPSEPISVPVWKKGRVVGSRLDYRSNNPERFYIVSRLPGWRVMQEYMKLATDTFISRSLDAGDPSARATTEEKMLAYSIGLKPYFIDFESQREWMAHRLIQALQEEWDRVNKNFIKRHNYMDKNWNYTRGQLLYPGDVMDETEAEGYSPGREQPE